MLLEEILKQYNKSLLIIIYINNPGRILLLIIVSIDIRQPYGLNLIINSTPPFLFYMYIWSKPIGQMSLNETGTITICTGINIVFLGAFFLFDKALVIAGNLLVIFGFVLILRSSTFSLLRFDKLQGTAFFALGIGMLIFKHALFGVLMEMIGLFMIFKSSLPSFTDLLYSVLLRKPMATKKIE